MPRKKGKFIDKKNAVSFRLVHRSQRDPLAADEDAPQHVLQPLDGTPAIGDPEEKRKTQVKYGVFFEDEYDYMQHLRSVEEYHNVHLSEPLNVPTEVDIPSEEDDPEGMRLFRKTPRGLVPVVNSKPTPGADPAKAKTTTTSAAAKEEDVVQVGDREMRLPASAFASAREGKVGLVNKGVENAHPSGPLIDWDPDIVEALDEDFNLDDPDNILDDDFVLKANQTGGFEESGEDDDDDDDSDGDWTSEDDSDEEYDEKAENVDSVTTRFDRATNLTSGVNPTSGEEVGDLKARIEEMKRSMAMDAMKRMKDGDGDEAGSDFDDADFDDLEETKSRFTEYSMTSSVIRRNDQLTLLDDRFEKLYEQYDDDQIGGLDGEDVGSGGGGSLFKIMPSIEEDRGDGSTNPFNDMLREFEKQNAKLTPAEVLAKLRDIEAKANAGGEEEEEEEDEERLVSLTTFEKPKEKNNWDCESILSTYSNLYNHPKTISEPSAKNRKKNNLDHDDGSSVSGKTGADKSQIKLSAKSGLPLGVLPASGPTQRQLEAMDYDGLTRLRTAPTLRPDDETAEDRRARKKAVKEERRERRMEKKANTAAFKDEEKKQKKNLTELQSNIQGIKIQ